MREILFRAKDNGVLNSVWQYGSLDISYPDAPTIVRIDRHNNKMFIPILIETVGQCTGLTDKNGKKIFEGDILRIGYCFGWDSEQEKKVPEEEYISKVYSIDCCPFCVDLQHCDGDMSPVAWLDWSYDDTEIEVIGNIHDNPELLKGGEG